jgi:hypothetical protein
MSRGVISVARCHMLELGRTLSMRKSMLAPMQIAVLGSLTMTAGCLFAQQHPEDARAPADFVEQWGKREKPCERPILVFPASAAPGRPKRELANISATCSPGSVELCERRLKERACALGADAILLGESEPGPNPAGGSRQSQVSRSARAVLWED